VSESDIVDDLFVWAHRYNGYERIAASPKDLHAVLEPARRTFVSEGVVPDWCGVDLLRGWLFGLARQERIWGSDPAEWAAVEDALRKHPAATADDLPVRGLEPE